MSRQVQGARGEASFHRVGDSTQSVSGPSYFPTQLLQPWRLGLCVSAVPSRGDLSLGYGPGPNSELLRLLPSTFIVIWAMSTLRRAGACHAGLNGLNMTVEV